MKTLIRLFEQFELRSTGKWFFLSAVVGMVAGLAAIVFQYAGQAVAHFSMSTVAGYTPLEAAGEHSLFHETAGVISPWLIVAVLAVGGLISGWLVYKFAPEAEGHGTDGAINAYHHQGGRIKTRVPFIKTLASAITLGTGGSCGREGPIAQIGAGFGSFFADRLKLSARDRRILMAAGMGAGVGAIFRAPLAGALFAGEILYRDADLESDVIIPSAISSIIGYSVFSLSLPEDKRFAPLFDIEGAADFLPGSPLELVPLALLSIVLVLAGIGYIKVFYGIHKLFKKLPGPPHVRPAIGAALAGLIAVGLYFLLGENPHALATLGTGYGALQTAFEPGGAEKLGVKLLLIIAVFKVLTTSLTISSGGSGGVFGPSMVIGGCLGAAVGEFCHKHLDGYLFAPTLQPQAYAVVGMAGFFAGCAHAPFSTIIMVSEMTGSYNLLLPTMWVSTLCFLLCRRWSLYEQQVANRLESPAHRGDFIVDVLEGIKVEEVYERDRKIVFIPESMPLEDIVHTIAETHQHYFPVVDTDERVVGIFSADDVRNYLYDETIWHLAFAGDVMVTNILGVTPEDDLNTALQRFTALNVDELPVFAPNTPGKLLGMLRQKEAIARYNRRLMEHKQAAAE